LTGGPAHHKLKPRVPRDAGKDQSMTGNDAFLIVVGVDGSEQSLTALQWAVTEARLRHGRVRIITAWYYPPRVSPGADDFIGESSEQAAEQIQDDALKTVADEDVDVTAQVVQGPPASALLDTASGADLLIVGSRGHGGFTGLLLGSVSTQVVHHARCPVLVIRPHTS
jgi:nucleotide-binding universal stress UspA family protein